MLVATIRLPSGVVKRRAFTARQIEESYKLGPGIAVHRVLHDGWVLVENLGSKDGQRAQLLSESSVRVLIDQFALSVIDEFLELSETPGDLRPEIERQIATFRSLQQDREAVAA